MNLEEIELHCNFDFEPIIKEKYSNIILDIFNNMCPDNYNISLDYNMDADVKIIIALYYISKKDYNKAIDILFEAITHASLEDNDDTNLRATCTLGILYNILNDKHKSIYYFEIGANKKHIHSCTNLAFEYLSQGEFDLFLKYNQIGLECNNDNALINQGIYLWNVIKDFDNSILIFNNLINNNNYRACFEYAKLIGDINQKIELLAKAIKLKPKKIYIETLKKYTDKFERNSIYLKYNIKTQQLKNYDNIEFNIKYNISKFSRCPICFNNGPEKIELLTLQCNHSFCINCLKKYCNNKCCLC